MENEKMSLQEIVDAIRKGIPIIWVEYHSLTVGIPICVTFDKRGYVSVDFENGHAMSSGFTSGLQEIEQGCYLFAECPTVAGLIEGEIEKRRKETDMLESFLRCVKKEKQNERKSDASDEGGMEK